MTCESVRDAMGEYLDGILCDTKQKEVESHLLACPDCRQEVQEVRETLGLLKQAGEVTPPKTLRPSVLAVLKREKTQQKRRFAPWIPQAMAAAVIFLLLVAGNVLPTQDRAPWDMRSLSTESGDWVEVDNFNDPPSEPGEAQPDIRTTDDSVNILTTDGMEQEAGGMKNGLEEGTRSPWRLWFNILLLPLFIILSLLALKKRKGVMP
jgi:hypothetical protein